MTNKQARLCRKISKYKTIERITSHCGMDELELEECFKPGQLDFEDTANGTDTLVSLTDELQEEYEERRRTIFHVYGSWVLSIIAILISIIALFR